MRVTALLGARPVMRSDEPGTNIPEPGEFGVAPLLTPYPDGCSYVHARAGLIPFAPAAGRSAPVAATRDVDGDRLAQKDDQTQGQQLRPHWERRARDRPFADGRLSPGETDAPAQTGLPHSNASAADDGLPPSIPRPRAEQPSGAPASARVLHFPRQRDPQREAAQARELMVRWCRQLSRRRNVRLAARNAAGEWINWYPHGADVEQAADGQPVAMLLTRRGRHRDQADLIYLVFDLDAKLQGPAQVAADEAVLTAYLESAGIGVVAATSGPGGGRHLWTSCPAGLPQALAARIREAATRLAPSLDPSTMSGSTYAAARVPGSPHRAGGYARLDAEHPAEFDAAIRMLRAGTGRGAFELLAAALESAAAATAPGDCVPSPRPAADAGARPIVFDAFGARALGLRKPKRTLPWSTAAALARVLDPDEDHSAHAARVLVGLALAGWQLDDVLLQARTAPGLEHLRSERTAPGARTRRALSPAQVEAHTARQFDHAVRYASTLPPPAEMIGDEAEAAEARLLAEIAVAVALEWVDAEQPGRWGGRFTPSGPADLAVVLYALMVMLRVGKTDDVELPCRSVARGTGRHHDTAARSLWRLDLDAVYLVRTAPAAGPHGARYALAPALLREASRRLAAVRAEHHEEGDDALKPTGQIDETAGQIHDRDVAAAITGAPTQGSPPAVDLGGGGGGRQIGGLRECGPVICSELMTVPGDGPGQSSAEGLWAGTASVGCQDELKVATPSKQDQIRPAMIVSDSRSARARIEADLRVLGADLFAHGTGRYDLGRHCAVTLLALTDATRRRRGGLQVQQIADATGLTGPKVERHLNALAERELAAHSPGRGWYATGVDVRQVDQGRGRGTAVRRAERHRVDAIVWAWWQSELAWLRMSRLEKKIDARQGRRRQPYGQQSIGPVDAAMFERLRYPRRPASIRQKDGTTVQDLVPDHAEAARIVAARIRASEGLAADPAAAAAARAWNPQLSGAPDFVRAAVVGELVGVGAA